MRGSPLIQAFSILIALTLLGLAGKWFITMDSGLSETKKSDESNPTTQNSHTSVEAEIELTFSSLPLSYSLKRLDAKNDQPNDSAIIIFKNKKTDVAIENPNYHDVNLPGHTLTTYWLDVIWPSPPAENSQHFIRITLSPVNGEAKSFTFSTTSSDLNETFDYTNAPTHTHE